MTHSIFTYNTLKSPIVLMAIGMLALAGCERKETVVVPDPAVTPSSSSSSSSGAGTSAIENPNAQDDTVLVVPPENAPK